MDATVKPAYFGGVVIPTVFVCGDERLLVVRCDTAKEAGHVWACLGSWISDFNVSSTHVRIWNGFETEWMSAFKFNQYWDGRDCADQEDFPPNAPKPR